MPTVRRLVATPKGPPEGRDRCYSEGQPVPETSPSFDEQVVLARVGGDTDLLREIAAIYLDSYESILQGVHDAVAANDAAALQSVAHLMKGTVATFEAVAATDVAFRLEQMGRNGTLTDAAAAAAELEAEVVRLAEDLTAYCRR